jgi:nucleoside diphosphate kinase
MTSAHFNIIKNVEESYAITIPDYVENRTLFARLTNTISFSATSTSAIAETMPMIVSAPIITIVPTSTLTGPTVATISTTAADCYALVGLTATFNATDTHLGLGCYAVSMVGSNPDTAQYYYGEYKSWIPFVVSISRGSVVASAILSVVATQTNTAVGSSRHIIGCENSANAVAPTTYNELNARTLTANTISDASQPIWNTGVTYTYDITTCVQEILNLSAWYNGNTLAVIMLGGGGSSVNLKRFASFENTTYTEPTLVITYTPD